MSDFADTDYEVGQDNIQTKIGPFGIDIHNPVFMISGVTIVLFVVFALALQTEASEFFGWLRPAITSVFDSFFLTEHHQEPAHQPMPQAL